MEYQEQRLFPTWKEFLETEKIEFGVSWTSDYLEAALQCKSDSVEFRFSIDKISRELVRRGMYITSEGSNGTVYRVVMPKHNAHVMHRMQRKAINAMYKSVTLGENTPRKMLTTDEQRVHEAVLEKAATRLALLSRSEKLLT